MRSSPYYTSKRGPLKCANFSGIKLLEYRKKIFEKILDRRLRKHAIWISFREMYDRCNIYHTTTEKNNRSAQGFVLTFADLEKVYDRVPSDLVYWCLRRGVPEKLVRLVETTYHGASTVLRTTHGRSDYFDPLQSWPTTVIRAQPIIVHRSTRCHEQ